MVDFFYCHPEAQNSETEIHNKINIIPAKAGIHTIDKTLDPRLRGDDVISN